MRVCEHLLHGALVFHEGVEGREQLLLRRRLLRRKLRRRRLEVFPQRLVPRLRTRLLWVRDPGW